MYRNLLLLSAQKSFSKIIITARRKKCASKVWEEFTVAYRMPYAEGMLTRSKNPVQLHAPFNIEVGMSSSKKKEELRI